MEKKKKMKKIKELQKNQLTIEENGKIEFYSYNTFIASYEHGKNILILSNYWDFSKTTSKYLYKFIEENTPYFLGDKSNKKAFINKLIDDKKIELIKVVK